MQKTIQDVQGDHGIVMAMGYGLFLLCFIAEGQGIRIIKNEVLIKYNSLVVPFKQRVNLLFVALIMFWVFINSLHSDSQSYIFFNMLFLPVQRLMIQKSSRKYFFKEMFAFSKIKPPLFH